MTDQTPTGVFVRLPLSEEQRTILIDADAFGKPDDSHDKAILSIGTPVTGGDIPVVTTLGTLRDPVPCVRQSDHLAKLAERDAEIARLRHHLERIDRLIMGNSDPVVMFCGIHASYTEALKGTEA